MRSQRFVTINSRKKRKKRTATVKQSYLSGNKTTLTLTKHLGKTE